MHKVVGSEEEEPLHPAERKTGRAIQARLAHRLQHLKTIRASRELQEHWAAELARRVRDERDEQRAATRSADEERAQHRLQTFLAREMAARPRHGGGAAETPCAGVGGDQTTG